MMNTTRCEGSNVEGDGQFPEWDSPALRATPKFSCTSISFCMGDEYSKRDMKT